MVFPLFLETPILYQPWNLWESYQTLSFGVLTEANPRDIFAGGEFRHHPMLGTRHPGGTFHQWQDSTGGGFFILQKYLCTSQWKKSFQNLPVVPCEDRCLGAPQRPPEKVFVWAPFTPPQKIFGGFWKTRVS